MMFIRHRAAGHGLPPGLISNCDSASAKRKCDVKSLIAGRPEDLAPLLGWLATKSRDFK